MGEGGGEDCYFQAEDGIRDYDVTGVQTCALPICGGFNNNIIKKAKVLLAESDKENKKLIAIGKKVNIAFNRSDLNYRPDGIGAAEDMFNDLSFENSSKIAQMLMDDFAAGKVDKDRKSTRLNSSHVVISYAVFCLKKKKRMSTNQSIT